MTSSGSPRNRSSFSVALLLLISGTLILRWAFPAQQAKLGSVMVTKEQSKVEHQTSAATKKEKDVVASQTKFQRPPPISYFEQHGNNSGLTKPDSKDYCTQNATSDYCCSEEHCDTIVSRSTLYSECCVNVHNNEHRHSKVFPLLITSAPRGGTWFMQQLLTKTGLQGLTTGDYSPTHTGTVSWKHIFQQNDRYFGHHHHQKSSVLQQSKFRVIWHLVRDPLKTLTSIAFTDPLWEDSRQSHAYIDFLSRHVPLTDKKTLLTQFNISQSELDGATQQRTIALRQNPKLGHFLIYRGLEIFLYWHGYINYLNIPMFRLEDLAVQMNVTILDEIFRSIGRDPPNHKTVMDMLATQERDHKRQHENQRRLRFLRRRLQKQFGYQGSNRGNRIRKGSRIHRATLTWKEICQVSEDKAHSLLEMSHSFGYYRNVSTETLCQ